MADDDAPLSALAKAPSRKFDDDTPLASLAAKKDAGSSKKVAPKAAGRPSNTPKAPAGKAVVAKPKAKANFKRKRESSSGSTTSSYSSTSSDSDDAPLRKKASKSQKVKTLRKKATAEDGEETGGAIRKKERDTKEELVAQLLCRWWYVDSYMKNDWPPQEEEFYQARLAEQKLRKVSIEEWEWLPENDESGCRKVYELSQFRGVFRNSAGELIDLRPKDTCPCFNNFIKKDRATLCTMLIQAYTNQMTDLKNCRYPTEKLEKDLRVALTKARNLLSSDSQMK